MSLGWLTIGGSPTISSERKPEQSEAMNADLKGSKSHGSDLRGMCRACGGGGLSLKGHVSEPAGKIRFLTGAEAEEAVAPDPSTSSRSARGKISSLLLRLAL